MPTAIKGKTVIRIKENSSQIYKKLKKKGFIIE
jgi:hypothetical protein